MTVLNDADKLYIGDITVDKVYAGDVEVWPDLTKGEIDE